MRPYLPTLEEAEAIVEAAQGSPVYTTSKAHLVHAVERFKGAFGPRVKIFYALKANFNKAIVQSLKEAGIDGIDAVSPFEVEYAKKLGFEASEILYTGNGCTDAELKAAQGAGVIANLGSISELERFGKLFPGAQCAVRLNVDVGAGECDFVVTGGEDTKFGISDRDLEAAKGLLREYDLKLTGVHGHIGSGFYEKESFLAGAKGVLDRAESFEGELEFVDLGGGFGIRYDLDSEAIDLADWAEAARPMLDDFAEDRGADFHYRLEPGKSLAGESTVLLTRVAMVKPERKTTFVGVDTGFNHLIRPALYGSYHQIVNLSAEPDRPMQRVTVVGNVCESGDIFGDEIELPEPREGDLLAIVCAGAYGASMGSFYQLRPQAAEVMVDGDRIEVTRGRMSFGELFEIL